MIKSALLQHFQGFIDGQWRAADTGETLKVLNPATGEQLATVPAMGAGETAEAIEAAAHRLATPAGPAERREWLGAIACKIREAKEELGRIITLEQGKPLREGVGEAEYAASFFDFYSRQAEALAPHSLAERIRDCGWTIHYRPAGVAGLITPWNFPLAMIAKKLAPALAAGCSVVTKPADLTPLSAIALWTIMDEVGLPEGLVNLVVGEPGPIGEQLCAHPAVRVISFTGSTQVGKLLADKTAAHIKRLAMELGGNCPFVVFDDADLEVAVEALMVNKFRAAGQTCVCTNRVYVHESFLKPFTELVVQRVSELRSGAGIDPATDIGPLINRQGFDKVARQVADALAQGAQRVWGEEPVRPRHDWGCFFPPTVLTGVTPEMTIYHEETFGPLVSIGTFATDAEVLELANGTAYGLAAYVFTQDQVRAERFTSQLRCGHVGYNTATGPTPEAPFGGMKQSGFGREGGIEGMLEFCETQTVVSG